MTADMVWQLVMTAADRVGQLSCRDLTRIGDGRDPGWAGGTLAQGRGAGGLEWQFLKVGEMKMFGLENCKGKRENVEKRS